MLTARKAGVFLVALLAGTGCSLTSKFLLSVHGTTADGSQEALASPLVQTTGMFFAMICALPLHLILSYCARRSVWQGGYQGVAEVPQKPIDLWVYFVMAAPAVFDMVATAMCMFGLVDVSVSLYQMLRGGSSIAFTSLMKHFFLPGDGLQLQNWVGVAFCLVSIFLCSAVAGGDPSSPSSPSTPATSNAPLVGVCLILGGGVVQSMQYVFEERIMSDDVGLAPLLVVALEGLWGFAFCCGVLLPLVYALPGSDHGHLEDPLSSLDMIAHSGAIQAFFGVYLLFIFAYNSFSVLVTKELDAVWHSILDLWRPVSVWLLSLAIHYSTELTLPGGASYGEAWVWPGSLVQLFAMGLLLYGTAIYNGSVAVPALVLSFLVASGVVARAEAEAARTPTPSKFASPYRSPLLVRSIRQASEGEHQRESAPDGRGGPELAPVPGVFELPKIPLGTRRFSEI